MNKKQADLLKKQQQQVNLKLASQFTKVFETKEAEYCWLVDVVVITAFVGVLTLFYV
jgi:hypothetical protein